MSATHLSVAAAPHRPPAADFSLVIGGPLFQLLRRAHLSDDALGLVHRRILVAIAIAWAPLLVMSALQGTLLSAPTTPFVKDVGFHLRFLVVVPLLIFAELGVHRRLRPIVEQFRVRNLVRPADEPRFAAALGEAIRWRNSALAELLLIILVYLVGVLITLRRYLVLGDGAWFAGSTDGRLKLAALWLAFVSLPILQFLLLRWYYRLFVWARFLWRVSRLDLDLNVTHPDKAGGLGFLGDSLIAFVFIAMAHGVLFAGMIASRIFYAGAHLSDFKMEVFEGAVFLVVVFAGPLLVFGPLLARIKRTGLREYGALGQTYVRDFRDKWLAGSAPADEPLVGSGDIQSLADLGNSFGSAEQTRFVPLRPSALVYFLAAFLAPILPLVLTMTSPEALLDRMAQLVF
jgi:hypothetical protein